MTLQAATDTACKVCAKPIPNRRSTLQTRCIPCVIAEANAKDRATAKAQRQAAIDARKKNAADRRQTKAKLEAIKPRSKWMAEAQQAFNAFIRLRDAELPCICCGNWPDTSDWTPGGVWDAGHFLSRGAHPELRFNEDNCHKQLKSCNAGSSKYAMKGRTVAQGYREGLIARIGLAAVEALEGPHAAKHYSVDDLRTIKHTYRVKARELQKETA